MQVNILTQAQFNKASWRKHLLEDGVVVCRGNHGLQDFFAFSNALGQDFLSTRPNAVNILSGNSGRFEHAEFPGVFLETGPTHRHPVDFHGELYFHHQNPPRALWAFCSDIQGTGEMLLLDAVAYYHALRPELQKILTENAITYHRFHTSEAWQALYPGVSLSRLRADLAVRGIEVEPLANGSITTRFRASAVVPYGTEWAFTNNMLSFLSRHFDPQDKTQAYVSLGASNAPFPEEIYHELQALARQKRFTFAWQAGDIMLIDNTRMMHGRHAIPEGQTRSIWIRMGNDTALEPLSPRPLYSATF